MIPWVPTPGVETQLPFDDGWPLTQIACPARTQCTALFTELGYYIPPSGLPEFQTFDPLRPARRRRNVPLYVLGVNQASGFKLGGYACVSVRLCVAAVGYGILVFRPSTVRGSRVQDLTPARVTTVTCPTANQCTAVGFQAAGAARRAGVEITFRPGRRVRAVPRVVDDSPLTTVVCRSGRQCTALDTRGRAVSFDPRQAAPLRVHRLGMGPQLTALACPQSTQCVVASRSGEVASFDPMSSAPAVRQRVERSQGITALACPTSSVCIALERAGHVLEGDPSVRRRWTDVAVPQAGALQAVTCPTATECVAVDDDGHAFIGRVR